MKEVNHKVIQENKAKKGVKAFTPKIWISFNHTNENKEVFYA